MAKSDPRGRAAAMREAQAQAERRRRTLVTSVVALVIVAVVAVIAVVATGGGGKKKSTAPTPGPTVSSSGFLTGPPGPEGIVLETGTPLAPAATPANGNPVDGIQCNSSEQVAYHIHTHLSIYVDGMLRPVPGGIGIVTPEAQQTPEGPFYGASRCYYWLHVHAQDGIIHIESPTTAKYTLGQFFAEWGQPLNATQVGPAKGTVTAYVNGKPYAGDPADIPLGSKEDVQLDLGSPSVAPKQVDWSKSQL